MYLFYSVLFCSVLFCSVLLDVLFYSTDLLYSTLLSSRLLSSSFLYPTLPYPTLPNPTQPNPILPCPALLCSTIVFVTVAKSLRGWHLIYSDGWAHYWGKYSTESIPAMCMKTASNFDKWTAHCTGPELSQKWVNSRSIRKGKHSICNHHSTYKENQSDPVPDK